MSENYRQKIEPILEMAGELILNLRAKGLEQQQKADETLVTNADHACNDFLTSALLASFPGDGIVSEENEDVSGLHSSHKWVIDPIDGTKHYASGSDAFCIMIARFDTQPIFSMMYYPVLKRWFWAERGKGAFMREDGKVTQLHIRSPQVPPKVLFSPSAPLQVGELGTRGTMKHFSRIATGKLDVYIKGPVSYWDLIPPMLLVQEAGGVVLDLEGKNLVLNNTLAQQSSTIAGHPVLVSQILKEK